MDKLLYQYYKEQGICPTCRKNPAVEGKVSCKECINRQNNYHKERYISPEMKRKKSEYNKKYRESLKENSEKYDRYNKMRDDSLEKLYNYRIENHLCTRCGNIVDNHQYVRCKECRDKDIIKCKKYQMSHRNQIHESQKESREFYKKHHICLSCRQNPALNDRKFCYECSIKRSFRNQQIYKKLKMDSNKYRESIDTNNIYHKNQYWKRKEAGICTRCGKANAVSGKILCIECATHMNNRKKNRYNTYIDPIIKPSLGICYYCDNPIREGVTKREKPFKVCNKHYHILANGLFNKTSK